MCTITGDGAPSFRAFLFALRPKKQILRLRVRCSAARGTKLHDLS
jgi:hypothetical protein